MAAEAGFHDFFESEEAHLGELLQQDQHVYLDDAVLAEHFV